MQLWTPEHAKTLLPALAVMILAAVVLRIILGAKSIQVRMIPFQVLAGILFLLEIGKQICSFSRGYDLYHLPFHFCSMFIFALPIMALYKGKHKQTVYGITAALCTAVLLLMLIYPDLIYSAGDINRFFTDYLSFHTVLFHNIVLFECVLIIALGLHTPQKGESKAVVWFTVCFCVVSATMAQLLKTNFNNFYSCNVPPLEDLRITVQGVLGYGLTQALYVLIVTVLDILFVLMSYWVYRFLRRIAIQKEFRIEKNKQRKIVAGK